MNDTLYLVLKGKWYDMIYSGEKIEEYREIKPYWIKRFCFHRKEPECTCNPALCGSCFKEGGYMCYPYEYVIFHRGYTNNTMNFKIKNIGYGFGNAKWGAPKNQVFIIKLGERI